MRIDKKYKWIARDESGMLYLYKEKPKKKLNDWDVDGFDFENLPDDNRKFESVRWQDEQPTELWQFELRKKIHGKTNSVTQPAHYHSGSIDPITFGEENFSQEEMKGFYRMNAIKYISRYDKKGTPTDDLNKAIFYISKLKELTE